MLSTITSFDINFVYKSLSTSFEGGPVSGVTVTDKRKILSYKRIEDCVSLTSFVQNMLDRIVFTLSNNTFLIIKNFLKCVEIVRF